MTQPSDSDYSQPTGASGTDIRTNYNAYYQGILTKNRGPAAPATTFPGMDWIDSSQTPEEWNIRNAANTAWNLFATIDASTGITILNQGAAVPGTGVANIFTASQTIDVTGSAGVMTVGSDRTTGIVASVDGRGHDSAANDTVYGSWDLEAVVNTNGAEEGQWVARVLAAGAEVARMTVGLIVSVVGTLNATTLQQGGVGVSTLIENEINSIDEDATSAAAVDVPADVTSGDMNTFTGASPSTWTINSGTAGEVYPVLNDGTADITFAAGAGVTIASGGLTLGQGLTATIYYRTATRVFIYGQNT